MTIGINAAAAVKLSRTGVEEYTYQLIKHLTMLPEAREHRFFLFVPSFLKEEGGFKKKELNPSHPPFKKGGENNPFDFSLPPNFEIKILRWPLPFLWTQIRLAWEMWRRKPEALFIPVHILPLGAPRNSAVTIHGLEYEYFPEHYPFWHKMYLRWSTRRAVRCARRLIAVSENTKNDLIKFYGAKAEKIEVVCHGGNFNPPTPPFTRGVNTETPLTQKGVGGLKGPYLLYIGRIETKKNIQGILEAYKILKEKYNIPHELVLAGAPGFGYEKLKLKIENCKLKIKELGYINEDTKRQLLSQADIFLFPSLYEGFGIPVLEAQAAGAPVVTSFGSSLPEVAGEGALFVNSRNPEQIAEVAKQIIDDKILRDKLIQSGFENVKRFSWEKCARRTLEVLVRE